MTEAGFSDDQADIRTASAFGTSTSMRVDAIDVVLHDDERHIAADVRGVRAMAPRLTGLDELARHLPITVMSAPATCLQLIRRSRVSTSSVRSGAVLGDGDHTTVCVDAPGPTGPTLTS